MRPLGLASRNGKEIIPPTNKEIRAHSFNGKSYFNIFDKEDGLYVFLEDLDRKIYLKTPIYPYQEIRYWDDDYLIISNAIINLKTGRQLFHDKYIEISAIFPDKKWVLLDKISKENIIDFDGNLILPYTIYRTIRVGKNGKLFFKIYDKKIADSLNLRSKYGLLDMETLAVEPTDFRTVNRTRNLLQVEKGFRSNKTHGIVNERGKLILSLEKQSIKYWNDSLALARNLVTNEGKIFNYITEEVIKDSLYYKEIYLKNQCGSVFYIVKNDQEVKVLDKNFKDILPKSHNYAVKTKEYGFEGIDKIEEEKVYTYYDCQGNLFTNEREIFTTYKLDENLSINDDKDEKRVLIRNDGFILKAVEGWENIEPANYRDYYVGMNKSRLWGMFNLKGEIVIPPIFYYLEPFKNRLAFYSINGGQKKGFISDLGEFLFEGLYDEATNLVPFNNVFGLYEVKVGQKIGVVNVKNEIIVPIIYDVIYLKKGILTAYNNSDKINYYYSLTGEEIMVK